MRRDLIDVDALAERLSRVADELGVDMSACHDPSCCIVVHRGNGECNCAFWTRKAGAIADDLSVVCRNSLDPTLDRLLARLVDDHIAGNESMRFARALVQLRAELACCDAALAVLKGAQ